MLTVACVLRTGGDYDMRRYVWRLQNAVSYHLGPDVPHRLVCLSNHPRIPGVEVIPLPEADPRWWGKMWLFGPKVFPEGARILYFDLDTVIWGSLRDWASYRGEAAILGDLYRPHNMIGSGALLWRVGTPRAREAWEAYRRNPDGIRRRYTRRMDEFLLPFWEDADRIQTLWPGQAVSYKKHCRKDGVPEGTRVVCFHGRPRPHELPKGHPVRLRWEDPTMG